MTLRTVAFVLLVAACTGAPPDGASGDPAGESPQISHAIGLPWIVYQGVFGGAVDLGMIHPDGTGDHRLPGGPGNRWHPAWSPDGRQIVYDWNLPTDVAQIAIMNIDGSDEQSLLECEAPCLGNGGPAWTPDGTGIGFDGAEGPTADRADDLCYLAILDLASGRVTRILEEPGCEFSASYLRFAPDGRRIVFQRLGPAGTALFTATVDGQDLRQLTDWGLGHRPDWAPDGSWIVFQDLDPDDPANAASAISIHRIRPDGTGLEQLTDPPIGTFDLYPRWVPNQRAILFSRCVDKRDCVILQLDPDGPTERVVLDVFGVQSVHVDWQPAP